MKDFQESIRQEANARYGRESISVSQDAFLAGAQAALKILGASAREGHPPRVKVRLSPSGFALGAESEKDFGYEKADPLIFTEYCAVSEMQSLRAADLLEIERFSMGAKIAPAVAKENEELRKELAATKEAGNIYIDELREALSQAREARKGDSADIETLRHELKMGHHCGEMLHVERERNARLTAALEKIAAPLPDNEVPDLQDEEASEKWMAAARKRRELAKEALAEAGKSND